VYSILKEWQVLKLTGETLEIESGNQSFSSKYFDDKERYEQLIKLLPGIFPERSSGKNQRESPRPCPHTKRTRKKGPQASSAQGFKTPPNSSGNLESV